MKRRIFVPVLVTAALVGAVDAAAQESDLISLELGVRGFIGELDGRLKKAPGTGHVRIDEDLDAAGDATGMGISLGGRIKGGHTFNVQGWQFSSDGDATQSESQTFGGITLAAGTPANSDVDVRYVSAKFVFGITDEKKPYRIGIGMAGKVIDWKTEIQSGGVSESLDMRMIYPSAEIELSYRVGEAVELKAEGGFGMPSFAKHSTEIHNPVEARAGVRISLGGLTLEAGYQVYDALLIEHENQPEENSANINMVGLYFELAARF
jgi:hypothetical protein